MSGKNRFNALVAIFVAVFMFGFIAHSRTAIAQTPTDLIASWLVTVDGESRTRVFRAQGAEEKPDGSVALKGRFGLVDGNLGAASGDITNTPEGRKLILTTSSDIVIVAVQEADGAFVGTITYKTGAVKPVRLAKTNAAELAASVKGSPAEDTSAKKGRSANSAITLVYWSSADCPYCKMWEQGSLSMYSKFREMPEYAKIKFYTVKNLSLKFGYEEEHFPPEISWVWERYQKTQRNPGRPGWQVYVGRKMVASFQGATGWESNHLPKIKEIIAQNSD